MSISCNGRESLEVRYSKAREIIRFWGMFFLRREWPPERYRLDDTTWEHAAVRRAFASVASPEPFGSRYHDPLMHNQHLHIHCDNDSSLIQSGLVDT